LFDRGQLTVLEKVNGRQKDFSLEEDFLHPEARFSIVEVRATFSTRQL